MQYIGFVGSSKADKCDVESIVKAIKIQLLKYPVDSTTIVSGHGEGIDIMSIKSAKEMGFKTIEYTPTSKNWEEYKKRNLQIAEECDKVYSIALALGTSKGWRKNVQCYHCKNAGKDTMHEKTAGCYTGRANGNYEVIVV